MTKIDKKWQWISRLVLVLLTSTLLACGSDGSPQGGDNTGDTTQIPVNNITDTFFKDTHSAAGKLSGNIQIEVVDDRPSASTQSIWVYWADEWGNTLGESWLKTAPETPYQIATLTDVSIPEGAKALVLYPANSTGLALHGSLIPFHDFIGNALLSGPGGNEMSAWYYGETRAKIAVQRQENGLCVFDNGLVSVTDMNNTRDAVWEASRGSGLPNQADDVAFPAYEFLCDQEPVNTYKDITDEVGTWTYSTLNDAMFYGTIVYDTFLKYLGEPPLEDKIRLRVHYGNQFDTSVNWDGAYANFSDGYLTHYSMASLDSIAHEVAHGVLIRMSELNIFERELSADARTLHEAFGDISGVMAKYEFSGHSNNWVHGEESSGWVRHLDQIVTETGAIPSYLDYDEAGDNYYKRIGMITYPFYWLVGRWGLETSYKVYLNSAKSCWQALTTLVEAAECIKQQTEIAGLPTDDVIAAFKTVKIQLFEAGVLSHFTAEADGLGVTFSDDSRSTTQVTSWLWDFGDGNTSTDASPEHAYAEAGDYQVSLRVGTEPNDQDVFERTVIVRSL